jgi:hypothetical protein
MWTGHSLEGWCSLKLDSLHDSSLAIDDSSQSRHWVHHWVQVSPPPNPDLHG